MEEELYRENILDHYKRPRNFERLEGAAGFAHENNPSCGDVIDFYLDVDGDRVRRAAFAGRGCAISQASASMLTEALKGRTLEEARGFGEETILALLGIPVGPMRMKCAMLSLRALKSALGEAKSRK